MPSLTLVCSARKSHDVQRCYRLSNREGSVIGEPATAYGLERRRMRRALPLPLILPAAIARSLRAATAAESVTTNTSAAACQEVDSGEDGLSAADLGDTFCALRNVAAWRSGDGHIRPALAFLDVGRRPGMAGRQRLTPGRRVRHCGNVRRGAQRRLRHPLTQQWHGSRASCAGRQYGVGSLV